MKSILLSILFILMPKLAVSQVSDNDKIIYLDSIWAPTSKGNHKYYKIIKDYHSDQKEYKIYVYYKNEKLKEQTTINGKDGGSPIGEAINYYENGNKEKIVNYINGKPTGKTVCFYENGNIQEEGEYTTNQEETGKSYKLNQYWDENKNHLIVDGNGIYSYGNNLGYTETGKYKDGYKDGIFEGKNLKEKTSFTEKYKNGKFISGTRTFADNTKKEYLEMETRPLPKKGMQDFYNFIGKNFSYTKESIKNNIKGKIYLRFDIDKDGKITEPVILKGLGYGLDEEAIRVLLKYGDWTPGEQRGQKVRCTFSIPLAIQTGR